MSDVATFQDFIESLSAKGRITSEDVLKLRRGVFPDGAIDRREAEAVFHLDRTCAEKISWRSVPGCVINAGPSGPVPNPWGRCDT